MSYTVPVPSLPTGLLAWYDARYGVTADANGRVSQWLDLSGHGNHAVQATAGNQPRLDTGTGPRIVFDHARNDSLAIPTTLVTTANAVSVFALVEADPSQTEYRQFVGLGSTATAYTASLGAGLSSGNLLVYDGSPHQVAGSPSQYPRLMGVISGTTRKVYVNSTTGLPTDTAGNATGQGGVIGNVFSPTDPGWALPATSRPCGSSTTPSQTPSYATDRPR